MVNQQSEESKARERAAQDLEDIETLKGTPAFKRYFERRVQGNLDIQKDKVLHDLNLTMEKLWSERLVYLAMRDVSLMLDQDEGACRRMLED